MELWMLNIQPKIEEAFQQIGIEIIIINVVNRETYIVHKDFEPKDRSLVGAIDVYIRLKYHTITTTIYNGDFSAAWWFYSRYTYDISTVEEIGEPKVNSCNKFDTMLNNIILHNKEMNIQ